MRSIQAWVVELPSSVMQEVPELGTRTKKLRTQTIQSPKAKGTQLYTLPWTNNTAPGKPVAVDCLGREDSFRPLISHLELKN